jgi:hypothetical protein
MTEKAPTPPWWEPYAAKWPAWNVWRGVNHLYYGSLPRQSPPIVVRGESPEDLSDMIGKAEFDRKSWWETTGPVI